MTYRVTSFPITLGRPTDPMILGMRMAGADVLRAEARAVVSRGNEAGVDAMTLGQRLVMHYMAATRASKFVRNFPAPVARWCFQVEQHTTQLAEEGFPAAPAMSVGGYGPGWLTVMPGNHVLINAGGVRAAGVIPADATYPIVLHEVREVRLTKATDLDGVATYNCTVIMSSDTGPRANAEEPVEDQPLVMEPEDQ